MNINIVIASILVLITFLIVLFTRKTEKNEWWKPELIEKRKIMPLTTLRRM